MHQRIIIAVVIAAVVSPASAGLFDKLKDPETGKLDSTELMLSDGGFVPIPIIITEPAVGFGFGVASSRVRVEASYTYVRIGHSDSPEGTQT